MLLENIKRRTVAAGHLIKHADEARMSTGRKSSFYRSAIVLLTTVIEGMTYEFVKKNSPPPHNVSHKTIYSEKHKLPASLVNSTNPVYICEKTRADLSIDDNNVGFGKYNIYLKNHSLINNEEYRLLDWAKDERNKIHIQGLTTRDTGYTKAKIEKLGKVIEFLVDKIK